MVQIIRSAERHHLDAGWLSTHWHFSFDDYYDPANISFGPLRVFNDDVIKPAGGFPMHPHKEMEIVTYVIDGSPASGAVVDYSGEIAPDSVVGAKTVLSRGTKRQASADSCAGGRKSCRRRFDSPRRHDLYFASFKWKNCGAYARRRTACVHFCSER